MWQFNVLKVIERRGNHEEKCSDKVEVKLVVLIYDGRLSQWG